MAVIDAAKGAGVEKIGVVTDGMRREAAGGSAADSYERWNLASVTTARPPSRASGSQRRGARPERPMAQSVRSMRATASAADGSAAHRRAASQAVECGRKEKAGGVRCERSRPLSSCADF